jgi:hypothetical protein
MKDKNKIRENFEEALDNFNFEKVHMIMQFLGWTWFADNANPPSIMQMKKEVETLFNDVLNGSDIISTGSGGFKVSVYMNGDVNIEFIPVQCRVEYGE